MERVQHLCPSADFDIRSSEPLDSTAGELADLSPTAWFSTSGHLL
jgi:hypothetical protein